MIGPSNAKLVIAGGGGSYNGGGAGLTGTAGGDGVSAHGFPGGLGGTGGLGGGGAFPGLAGGAGSSFFSAPAGGVGGGGGATSAAGGGGGGGSFDAGLNPILEAGVRAGNGEVMITELASSVPEPSSLAMIATGLAGLAGLGAMRRRFEGLSALASSITSTRR